MFEDWPIKFTPAPRRVYDPPVPVVIDLGRAFARTPRPARRGLALRVKAEGLHLTGTARGLLEAWVRTTSGDWIGLCEVELHSGNRQGTLHTHQWCPSGAITAAPTWQT